MHMPSSASASPHPRWAREPVLQIPSAGGGNGFRKNKTEQKMQRKNKTKKKKTKKKRKKKQKKKISDNNNNNHKLKNGRKEFMCCLHLVFPLHLSLFACLNYLFLVQLTFWILTIILVFSFLPTNSKSFLPRMSSFPAHHS